RSALDIVVGDFKKEIINNPIVTRINIQPSPYPIPIPANIPNLVRYSSRNATASGASNTSSSDVSANGRWISGGRWNSHYLIPLSNPSCTTVPTPTPTATPSATATATPSPTSTATPIILCSDPIPSFVPPDWVLVTAQGATPSSP